MARGQNNSGICCIYSSQISLNDKDQLLILGFAPAAEGGRGVKSAICDCGVFIWVWGVVGHTLQVVADPDPPRSTSSCVRPTLELWNSHLRRMFSAPWPLNCSSVERNWVYVDNATLHIDDSAVQLHGPIDCHYTPVRRGRNDFEVCTLQQKAAKPSYL